MIRFFETLSKSVAHSERKLNLSDLALGDNSATVIGKIIKTNPHFSILVSTVSKIDVFRILGKT